MNCCEYPLEPLLLSRRLLVSDKEALPGVGGAGLQEEGQVAVARLVVQVSGRPGDGGQLV